MTSNAAAAPALGNSYLELPERLYQRVEPTAVARPAVVRLNRALAVELGLDPAWLASDDGAAMLAGNAVPEGATPVALAYAGHQFGGFVPQLGDGRAVLLGEVVDAAGVRRDVQLKGSGRTRYSRGGDGRAWLGPVLREYLVSEAMHALGIPTTRALAAATTGEVVVREGPLPGAVLTRVAASHLRVGSFEFAAARQDRDGLRALRDYAIERHDPAAAESANPTLALLRTVMQRQADLVARWLGVGFVHGVMNTDNTSISGETIDYGPCAFMDRFDVGTVFSSIDRNGRYAYGAQSRIIGWNMARLAEAMLVIVHDDPEVAVAMAQETVEVFPALMEAAWLEVMWAKLGLATARDGDGALVSELLVALKAGAGDFTNSFRALCLAADDPAADELVRAELSAPERYDAWAANWRDRLALEPEHARGRCERMQAVNPAFIPRNHRVEAALAAAVAGDYQPFDDLAQLLSRPYQDQPGHDDDRRPAPASAPAYRTFCGT